MISFTDAIFHSFHFQILGNIFDEDQAEKKNSIYEKLHLGLLQTILGKVIRNAQVLVLLLIGMNIAVSTSDTWSDVMIFIYLIRAQFYEYAVLIGIIDMLPG